MRPFLVTTADERTWPEGRRILFLGEWCRLYERRERWELLDAGVVPYHWDDREALYHDYRYLKELHETLLGELAERLNRLHGVEHGLRYWRILIGPWLGYFVQMLFDRWAMLKLAVEKYDVGGCWVLARDAAAMIPNDMAQFGEFFVNDDWNEAVYGQLLRGHWSDDLSLETVAEGDAAAVTGDFVVPWSTRVKRVVAGALSKANLWMTGENDYFFLSSYLPLPSEFKLQFRLGQVPKLWRPIAPPFVEADMAMRDWSWESPAEEGEFAAAARRLIPKHLPKLYLEGYPALMERAHGLRWPRSPKVIFTCNAHGADEVFKAWAAEKCEAGVPLVIGQHGGHFGMTPWAFHEEHQIGIADAWVSWGWSDSNQPKIVPVGYLKGVGRKITYDPQGGALMVEMALPRYSYHMYAVPVAGQWLSYFEDQCRFVSSLSKPVREQLKVRLFPRDFGWSQRARWQARIPDIRFDAGGRPVAKVVAGCRLYISTYNATTYLESLAWNVPTIMFWNPGHWELKPGVEALFEGLESVGVFHRTPESAARQASEVWDDVQGWWESDAVQRAREAFCQVYARQSDHTLAELERLLRDIGRRAAA